MAHAEPSPGDESLPVSRAGPAVGGCLGGELTEGPKVAPRPLLRGRCQRGVTCKGTGGAGCAARATFPCEGVGGPATTQLLRGLRAWGQTLTLSLGVAG